MKSNKFFLMAVVMSLLFSACSREEAEMTEIIKSNPVKVEVVELAPISNTYYGIGELYAADEIDILTGKGGLVENIHVKVGDAVDKGQILFELNNEQLKHQIDSKESQLKSQKELAAINLSNAQIKLKQTEALFKANAVSKSDLDDVKSEYNRAQIAYDNSSKVYSSSMMTLNEDLEDTFVKSTIEGTVAAIYIKQGQEVGSEVAMKIVDSSAMKMIIKVPEKIVAKIKKGQEAKIWSDLEKYNYVSGSVNDVDLTTRSTLSLYAVELLIEKPNERLLSGMFVETEILIDKKDEAVVIDKSTVLRDGDESFVFVALDDRSIKTSIETGIELGNSIEVIKGLKAGTPIVTRGHEYLSGGEYLDIVEVYSD